MSALGQEFETLVQRRLQTTARSEAEWYGLIVLKAPDPLELQILIFDGVRSFLYEWNESVGTLTLRNWGPTQKPIEEDDGLKINHAEMTVAWMAKKPFKRWETCKGRVLSLDIYPCHRRS